MSLDERMSFLDQCEDVLHLCYADVAHCVESRFDALRYHSVVAKTYRKKIAVTQTITEKRAIPLKVFFKA